MEAPSGAEPETTAVVHELLSDAARVGELAVAWARLTGGLAITIAWPIVHGDNLWNSVPRVWGTLILGLLALAWSVFVVRQLRRSNPGPLLIYASITVDALLFNGVLWSYQLAPSATHQSIVEVHGSAFVYLAIVTAGIRLNVRAAYYGAILNSVLFALLVAISTVQAENLRIIGFPEWTTVGIGLVGSTVLGVNIAGRTVKLVHRSARETLASAKARARLGAYVSPEVADVVLREATVRLGGQRQSVAVLFSDLRGFTRYSEGLEPEQIVEQLNDYMGAMVSTIAQHGGIVDKFIGDGIMAVFGAPVPGADDADRAVECAIAMMRAIESHNAIRQSRGLPELKHGIGVHFGPVIAGNVGSARRAAYTVIGDTVNLASRLEQLTKRTSADVIVSRETVAACTRQHPLTRMDEVPIPGRDQSVAIYGWTN